MGMQFERRAGSRRRSDLNDTLTSERLPDLAVELAHDVRSPLGAIIALTEVLKSAMCGPVTDAQARHLNLVLQAAHGISRVTDDMVELDRHARTGQQEPMLA